MRSVRLARIVIPVLLVGLALLSGLRESVAYDKIQSRTLKYAPRRKNMPTPTPEPSPTPEASPTPAPSPTPGIEGSAEASLASTSGNTSTSNFGVSLDLAYKPQPWFYQFKGSYLSSSTSGALTSERASIEARSSRRLSERRDVFADMLLLMNRFAGIDSQVNPEIGYGYEWLLADSLQLRTEEALGYSFQRQTDGTKLNYVSGRFGFLFAWKISEGADFSHETSYFADFQNGSDWRVRSETALTSQVTKRIALKASYLYEFFNTPAASTAQDNGTFKSSVLLNF